MYILKNSLKNLMRNKGRNILIGIIMTVILSCASISLIIDTTSAEIINDYKNRFGAEVFIQTNMEKTQEMINEGKIEELNKGVPNKTKEKISKSKYLKNSIFSLSFSGYSDEIKALDQPEGSDDIDTSNVIAIGGKSNIIKRPNMNVLGGLNEEGLKEFKNGSRKILKGRMPKRENEALVSEKFAELNNLDIGRDISIKNPQNPSDKNYLNLNIVGIYYDGVSTENTYGIKHPMLNRSNEIITTFDTLKNYNRKTNEELINMDVKYYLKNPDLLEEFNDEAHKLGLSDMYDLSVDSNTYNSIVKPVEGLKDISNIFMILVLFFGGSILTVISILSIRERKYEIGVLRAMGMKKIKVALGLILETLSIIILSLIVGLFTGNLFAQPIADILLKGQIAAQNEIESMSAFVGIGAQSNSVNTLEKIDVFLNGKTIVGIVAVAIILAILSTSIGIVYINRYEPRKILTERN